MEAYFDNSATTKALDSVRDIMVKTLTEDFGNPSAKHTKGMEAENYIRQAAADIAKTLKVKDKEILFTSGGTESNNMALIGTALANQRAGKHIISTRIEHASVYQPLAFLESLGFEVTYLHVDHNGHISLEELEQYVVRDKKKVKKVEYKDNTAIGKPTREVIEETENVRAVQGPVDRLGLSQVTNALKNIKELYAVSVDMDSKKYQAELDRRKAEKEGGETAEYESDGFMEALQSDVKDTFKEDDSVET